MARKHFRRPTARRLRFAKQDKFVVGDRSNPSELDDHGGQVVQGNKAAIDLLVTNEQFAESVEPAVADLDHSACLTEEYIGRTAVGIAIQMEAKHLPPAIRPLQKRANVGCCFRGILLLDFERQAMRQQVFIDCANELSRISSRNRCIAKLEFTYRPFDELGCGSHLSMVQLDGDWHGCSDA